MDFAKFSEYGLIGLIIGVLFFFLWRMLVWVMKWVDTQAEQHRNERLAWQEVLSSLNASINLHNQGSMESRKSSEEAHKYQKDEHEKLSVQMNEVTKALGRINGYKHD